MRFVTLPTPHGTQVQVSIYHVTHITPVQLHREGPIYSRVHFGHLSNEDVDMAPAALAVLLEKARHTELPAPLSLEDWSRFQVQLQAEVQG